MSQRDTLWIALENAIQEDPSDFIRRGRDSGLSWRELEAVCAQHGVPVSHEWLRQQARDRGE